MELVPTRFFSLIALLALTACVPMEKPDSGDPDVEEDCDGAGMGTFYADADGDGYGDAAVSVEGCEAPDGHVDNAEDCDDADASADPSDADGDGVTSCDGDCDDADAGALPGAAETCDGADNDCDGETDEPDATDASSWYADVDGDGYGDAASATTACEEPAGSVDNMDDCDDADAELNAADLDADTVTTCDGDCDDAQPAAYPGAVEACDAIDNDCDAEIDESGATGEGTFYADADGDAYGDAAVATVACWQPEGTVTDATDCDDTRADVSPGAVETCNGVDDNCDTVTDEGSADLDADGVYDCFDEACTVATSSGGTTTVDDTCLAPDIVVEDPWNAVVEWQWVNLSTSSTVRDSYIAPKVGNLTDTDGDGDVDSDDTPNVLLNTLSGHLVLLDGATGTEIWAVSGMDNAGETAIVDVDGDGDNDVLAFDSSGRSTLLDASGAVLWTAAAGPALSYPLQTVADLDGDGVVEVITSTQVLDGQTGAIEVTFSTNTSIPYYMPAVGDIDLDGQQEVILGNKVFSPDGSLEWTSSVTGTYGHWSAIVDVDGDPEGEVLMVGGSQVVVHDHDGTVLYSTTTTDAARPGPICVADFDGDGTVEAAWGSQSVFSVYELDATRVWSATISDSSGLAGCSAYDFDSDGVYEVLMADENTLWAFDGATGTVRFSQDGHSSGTVFEYPVVADVDNDGSAEILYVSNYFSSDWATLTVLGHAEGAWPRSGSTWPTHDYAATNVNTDGSVPTDPTPSWQIYNVYRARPAVDTAATNLYVEIVDSCASSCDDTVGTVTVAVQVSNEGGADITEAVTLVLYDTDSGVALDTVTLAGGLASGEMAASLELSANLADIGAGGVHVVVDDDGAGAGSLDECDESDNAVAWSGPVCE